MAPAKAKAGRGNGTKPKTAPKRKRKPKAETTDPTQSLAFLESVKAENPSITSDEFALKFNLPFEEVARHKAFVLQYLLDFNEKAAAMRLGYPEATARDTGKMFLHYPYAQVLLAELQRAATVESMVTAGEVLGALKREMNAPDVPFSSNATTRIAAASQLAKILGLTKPKAPKVNPELRPIMVIGNVNLNQPDNWEDVAKQSQRKLRESVAIDV